MVYYKLVKFIIDLPSLSKVILDILVEYQSFLDSIGINKSLLFTSKFWSSLYYFFGIKCRLFIAFHPQTNSQTKRQNSTMKTHLYVFDNFKQNNWVKLFLIAEFTYNNAKNTSTGYIPFRLNCFISLIKKTSQI